MGGESADVIAAVEKGYKCCGLRGFWKRSLAIPNEALVGALFTRVADLLSADVKAGEDERQRGEDEQAGDGNPGGRRLGEHGERALRRGNGHERLKVMNDTQLL